MSYYRNAKTADQLTAEIAYFHTQLARTTSPDRQRRARAAIGKRERLLVTAMAVRVQAVTDALELPGVFPGGNRERRAASTRR